MEEFNANQYPTVYDALGINLGRLGCIMLDVNPIPITTLIPGRENDLYHSTHPDRRHIRGAVAETSPHTTLLYGLLQSGPTLKPLIDQVLEGWTPPPLTINHVGTFPSPYNDEPFDTLIAHITPTPELVEGHQRLSLLPHINTFPTYQPHLTLAYLKPGTSEHWIEELHGKLDHQQFTVNRINYGKHF